MKSSAAKIQVTGLDALFGEAPAQAAGDQIKEVPLAELHPFKDHPFHVVDDEKMQEMAESVTQYGVLVPGIVRPRPEGGYEIVVGHRRKRASELAGKTAMPVIVRDMDDDEATIIMVDSNLQREKILPSEKAYAYRMKPEAMKHQGERRDLTSSPLGMKLAGKQSLDVMAEIIGESRNQIHRFIHLTYLAPFPTPNGRRKQAGVKASGRDFPFDKGGTSAAVKSNEPADGYPYIRTGLAAQSIQPEWTAQCQCDGRCAG